MTRDELIEKLKEMPEGKHVWFRHNETYYDIEVVTTFSVHITYNQKHFASHKFEGIALE